MAAPSQAQVGLLAGLRGLSEGISGAAEQEQQMQRAKMLQDAIERRQEERDVRASLPKTLYGPLWSKMTGLPLPEESPDYLSPTMGSVMLRYPSTEETNASRERIAKTRAAAVGGKQDKTKILADVYRQALAAGARALGGKTSINPNYANIVGPQRDLFNQAAANEWLARMKGVGLTEAAPSFLELGQAAQPHSGGFLGFGGTPAQQETSRLAAVPWAGQTTAAPVTSGGDRVANIVRGYRANKGWNDVQISNALKAAGVNMTPEQIAQIQ